MAEVLCEGKYEVNEASYFFIPKTIISTEWQIESRIKLFGIMASGERTVERILHGMS